MTVPTVRWLPGPGKNRVFGELMLSLPGLNGATVFVADCSADPGNFHLLIAGDTGIALFRDYQLIDVALVRSTAPRPLPVATSSTRCVWPLSFPCNDSVENGRQLIPLPGIAELEPVSYTHLTLPTKA